MAGGSSVCGARQFESVQGGWGLVRKDAPLKMRLTGYWWCEGSRIDNDPAMDSHSGLSREGEEGQRLARRQQAILRLVLVG